MIAGFPCQTFSILGKRDGFNDNRGIIIYYLIEILKQKNVPYFLFENVKGLISHDKGNTLKIILEKLNEAGYDVFYQVLNSLNFGVPQHRERIYLVGFKKELGVKNFQFPHGVNQKNITDFFDEENDDIFDTNSLIFQKYINNKYNIKKNINLDKVLLEKNFIDIRQSDIRVYKEYCPTLRNGRHGILYFYKNELKKLSPYETLLLQGFPKNYAIKIKNNPSINQNKVLSQAGNAMTVNVVKSVVSAMLKNKK